MSIFIRVLRYGYQYRGLMIHAVDVSGATVGEFEVPEDDFPLAHTPSICPGVLFHTSAAEKPYRMQLSFLAPPSGTGTITFRTLLKSGPANDGAFHYPFRDLVLREADPFAAKWFLADAGETCEVCCERNGRSGVDETTMANRAGALFEAAVEPLQACVLPVLSSCDPLAPDLDPATGLCYYQSPSCPEWRSTSLSSNRNRPFCACNGGTEFNSMLLNAASPTRPSQVWTSLGLFLAIAQALWPQLPDSLRKGAMGPSMLLLVVLGVCVGRAEAHNWLHTPGRASTQASTLFPCPPRKATDLHAQVSRTQPVTLKWATGHTSPSYWIVVAGADEALLAQSNLKDIMDAYIAAAPAGSNLAQDPAHVRLHGTYKTDLSQYLNPSDPIGSLYARQVPSSDPSFISHPRSASPNLFQYRSDLQADDVYVSYINDEYPWIEAVMRYDHEYSLASDFDTVALNVPGRSGDGHYIALWYWSGYYDCTDIDVRSENVAEPYGLDSGGYIYNRIDHCQYVEPDEVVSDCMEATVDVFGCAQALPSWLPNDRLGINAVPVVNPASVFPGFRREVNIPWNDPDCVEHSSMLKLSGEVSESSQSWSWWQSHTRRVAGQRCVSYVTTPNGYSDTFTTRFSSQGEFYWRIDLKRAVAACVGDARCVGLTWQADPAITGDFPTVGDHYIMLCASTTTVADPDFVSVFPQNLATYSDAPGSLVTYSFMPAWKASTISLPANGFADSGDAYGTRGNYGWRCAESCDYPWGCPAYDCDAALTWQNTWNYFEDGCPEDPSKPKVWEAAVANGVYEVTLMADRGDSATESAFGCSFEGSMASDVFDEAAAPVLLTRQVLVKDGLFSLSSNPDHGCYTVNYVTLRKLKDNWDQSWMPSAANPWWQLKMASAQPVGLVKIENPARVNEQDDSNCAAWWLFRGKDCFEGVPMGWFNHSDEGATVGVSDSPCANDECSGTVCGVVNVAELWDGHRDYWVDCKGARGQYVWVRLPGSARALVFSVQVWRAYPDVPSLPAGENTTVCYGVRPRELTATQPEYVISLDPEDPIFYSTCYVRERNITWLDVAAGFTATPPRWRFNGRCLDCVAFNTNQELGNLSLPMTWTLAEENCVNCDLEVPPAPVTPRVLESFSGLCNSDKHTCDLDSTTEVPEDYCLKRICPLGRCSGDRWQGQYMRPEECVLLAQRDPECQPIASLNDVATAEEGGSYYCTCWRNDECCGRCTPTSWAQDWHTFVSENVDPNSAQPDPSCDTGLVSANGEGCCPSYCQVNGQSKCGTNDCEWGWAGFGGGACCPQVYLQSCREAGPPCLL